MTRRLPYLGVVGPNVRALPRAAGDYERRSPVLAAVQPLPLDPVTARRWLAMGVTGLVASIGFLAVVKPHAPRIAPDSPASASFAVPGRPSVDLPAGPPLSAVIESIIRANP